MYIERNVKFRLIRVLEQKEKKISGFPELWFQKIFVLRFDRGE